MDWKPRLATVALTIGALGTLSLGLTPSILPLVVGLGLVWYVPGWWRAILYGAIGGLVAGILVLGPGLRLAMRVVAILDPVRQAEFTLEGTLFILVMIGGLFGLTLGVLGALTRAGWSTKPGVAWTVPAFFVMLMLMVTEEFRTELLTLGAGPWVNIPMFSAVAGAYGWVAMRIVGRLESRWEAEQASIGHLGVPG